MEFYTYMKNKRKTKLERQALNCIICEAIENITFATVAKTFK
jgi:hypothetical protein